MGTAADNMRDMRIWGDVAKGEKNMQSKLSEDDVISIRKIYKSGEKNYKELAAIYGVDQSQIGNIVRRVYWTHLT